MGGKTILRSFQPLYPRGYGRWSSREDDVVRSPMRCIVVCGMAVLATLRRVAGLVGSALEDCVLTRFQEYHSSSSRVENGRKESSTKLEGEDNVS